jgi:hypothetical protein
MEVGTFSSYILCIILVLFYIYKSILWVTSFRYYGPGPVAGGSIEQQPGPSKVETASRKKMALPSYTSTPAASHRLQLLKEQQYESSAE